MGMEGPGNNPSFMMTRDLSRSVEIVDANKRLVWVTGMETKISTRIALKQSHTPPNCRAPFTACSRLQFHRVNDVKDVFKYFHP